MRHALIAAVAALFVVGILSNVGCGGRLTPLYVPTSPAGLSAGGVPFAAQQVEEATAQAAIYGGWKIVHRAPGLVIADVAAGKHGARVRILSDATGWRIEHEQSSPSMRWSVNPRHGQVINRRYNQWVKALDDGIRRALYSPAVSAGGYYPPPAAEAAPAAAAPAPQDPQAAPPPPPPTQ